MVDPHADTDTDEIELGPEALHLLKVNSQLSLIGKLEITKYQLANVRIGFRRIYCQIVRVILYYYINVLKKELITCETYNNMDEFEDRGAILIGEVFKVISQMRELNET